ARQRDGAAVGLHHLARDPQAEAQAAEASAGYGALEALEYAGLVAETDANPVIAHLEARHGAEAADHDFHRLARAELDGVGEQIVDHLIEAGRGPVHRQRLPRPPPPPARRPGGR